MHEDGGHVRSWSLMLLLICSNLFSMEFIIFAYVTCVSPELRTIELCSYIGSKCVCQCFSSTHLVLLPSVKDGMMIITGTDESCCRLREFELLQPEGVGGVVTPSSTAAPVL